MRFIVLGTSKFTLSCTKGLLESGADVCAIISMPEDALPNDSIDLSVFSKLEDIGYHEFENINSPETISLLKSYLPDYIFCSWPKIIRHEVLSIPKYSVIGTHTTDLPFNRGRHPHHWFIAMGISISKMSFFVMDEGIDTGDIMLQVPFDIADTDTVCDIDEKVEKAGYKGIKELYGKIYSTSCEWVKQDNSLANYWRKRTPYDVTLDMRMSVDIILRTVRSFTLPYPCANLIFEKYVIKICRAEAVKDFEMPKYHQFMEHGKIVCIKDKSIRVKVDDGIVDFECVDTVPIELLQAEYIHPPLKYFYKWYNELGKQL